jgi:hypothetical protein
MDQYLRVVVNPDTSGRERRCGPVCACCGEFWIVRSESQLWFYMYVMW